MRYAELKKGKRAERPLTCPVPAEDGGEAVELACVAVPLAGDEEAECLAFALKYAKDKGVLAEHAKLGEPLFDLGYMAKVVELTVRDPDTGEPGKRLATFTGGTDEVLRELQRETIAYLFRIAEAWADTCSPLRRRMSDAEMLEGIRKLAAEGDDGLRFFDACGPSLRFNLARFMARQLVTLLEAKSGSGSSTATRIETPTPSSP